jgi:rhodanese-related sulfurtransferase
MKYKYIASCLLIAVVGYTQAQTIASKDVAPNDFKTLMDSISDEVILDLRTTDEMVGGIIAGAKQLDYFSKDFIAGIDNLSKEKTYLIYCASGARSGETKELMAAKGFKNVYNLSGGFNLWKKKKMPIAPFR